MPYSFKRIVGVLTMLIILDVFVTYHSWWQRIVVIVAQAVVWRCIDTWARNEEISKLNPPRSY